MCLQCKYQLRTHRATIIIRLTFKNHSSPQRSFGDKINDFSFFVVVRNVIRIQPLLNQYPLSSELLQFKKYIENRVQIQQKDRIIHSTIPCNM